jgi:hypothetical protein
MPPGGDEAGNHGGTAIDIKYGVKFSRRYNSIKKN